MLWLIVLLQSPRALELKFANWWAAIFSFCERAGFNGSLINYSKSYGFCSSKAGPDHYMTTTIDKKTVSLLEKKEQKDSTLLLQLVLDTDFKETFFSCSTAIFLLVINLKWKWLLHSEMLQGRNPWWLPLSSALEFLWSMLCTGHK